MAKKGLLSKRERKLLGIRFSTGWVTSPPDPGAALWLRMATAIEPGQRSDPLATSLVTLLAPLGLIPDGHIPTGERRRLRRSLVEGDAVAAGVAAVLASRRPGPPDWRAYGADPGSGGHHHGGHHAGFDGGHHGGCDGGGHGGH